MPIAEVTSADVIGILAPIWYDKAPTARKLRQRIRAIMEWAVAMDLRPDNPCDRIGPVLGAQGNTVRHMRALLHGEVAAGAPDGAGVERAAGGEAGVRVPGPDGDTLRRGPWGALDGDRPGREDVDHPGPTHEGESGAPVRCADERWEILKQARALDRVSPSFFRAWAEKPLGNTAMSELLRALRIAAVPHGFRSSFRDWAAEETDHPREVAEAALAHKVRNPIEGSHRRTDLFDRRGWLMDDWADYLDQQTAVSL